MLCKRSLLYADALTEKSEISIIIRIVSAVIFFFIKKLQFKNYLFLKKAHGFKNIANEVPVIYERDGTVLFVGTLDQIIELDGKCGINDFKRVSSPNKQKIIYQLNLYKLAYEQSYNKKIDFLSYTHLRETVRKFNMLPIGEEVTLNLLNEFLESEKQKNGNIIEGN